MSLAVFNRSRIEAPRSEIMVMPAMSSSSCVFVERKAFFSRDVSLGSPQLFRESGQPNREKTESPQYHCPNLREFPRDLCAWGDPLQSKPQVLSPGTKRLKIGR